MWPAPALPLTTSKLAFRLGARQGGLGTAGKPAEAPDAATASAATAAGAASSASGVLGRIIARPPGPRRTPLVVPAQPPLERAQLVAQGLGQLLAEAREVLVDGRQLELPLPGVDGQQTLHVVGVHI